MDGSVKRLSWLIIAFALACCAGAVSAQCVPVVNTPVYSFQTLPGQTLKVNVGETGCPSSSVTNITVAPSGSDSVITLAGSFSSFTVGKFMQFTTGLGYPYDIIQNAFLQILSANSTTLTAKYVGHNITFGSTAITGTVIQVSKINWSVATTTGTQTATLACTSSCLPGGLKVTMGAVNGHCSLSGTTPFPMTCTQAVTLTATAVDGGGSVTFPIYGAGVTTSVMIDGAYKQLYENQVGRLQTQIMGNANHNINWTHTGTCTVVGPSNKRDIYFYSATSQHCTFTATSAADGSKTDTRLIYIVAAAVPSYGAGPEKTEPVPCAIDATLTGTVYEVGPTQANTTLNAVPFNTWTGGGHIVRIHNEDTGTTPTTFHEYIQPGFDAATKTNPDYICGIANSLGYHPVLDGNGATGPSYNNGFINGGGLVNVSPTPSCNGNWPSTCPPSYLAVAGLTLIHATAAQVTSWDIGTAGANKLTITALAGSVLTFHAGDTVLLTGFTTSTFLNNQPVTVLSAGLSTTQFEANFTHANGSGTESQAYAGYMGTATNGTSPFSWGDGSAGLDFRVGTHLEAYGNHCNIDSQCVGTYDNGDDHGFAAITQAVSIQRNFADTMGFGGSFLSHPFYMQSFGMELWGNLINQPAAQSSGSCIKIRGVGVDTVNNYCATGFARHKDWVEVQDAAEYTNIDNYVGGGAWPTDTADADVIIGYTEELLDDNVELGSAVNDPAFYGNARHFMGDHDNNLGSMGMNARYGILSSAYETYYGCGQVFDTIGLGGDNFWLSPEWVLSNSTIICPVGEFHFNSLSMAIVTAQTNMFLNGTIDNSLDIYGGRYNNGTAVSWTSDWAVGMPLMSAALNYHLNGNLTTDYKIASSVPFNTTTLVPGSSSPLVGQATGLAGEAALFTLAYNAVALDGSISPRIDTTTIGAYDPSGGPTVVSIAVTPNPASVVTSSTVNLTATATWSDSTTTNVTTLASWSNGGSSHFTVGASTGVVTGVSVGSGTASATYSAITGNGTVNVSAPSVSNNAVIRGNVKITGSVKVQ